MGTLIAYKKDESNALVLLIPNQDCGLDIETIAKKDVPTGKPFIFVKRSELPEDGLVFFDAWEADFSNPDGYGA